MTLRLTDLTSRVDVYRKHPGNGGRCVILRTLQLDTHMPTGLVVTCPGREVRLRIKEKAQGPLSQTYSFSYLEQNDKIAAEKVR